MQQNVVLYAFPWYQPQLEPRKQFGKYIVTSLIIGTCIEVTTSFPGFWNVNIEIVQAWRVLYFFT